MRVISLTCNHCGAPLEVPKDTRFVTCKYCSARLQVHESGSAVYTEVLEAIQERTDQMADDIETIKMQNELERLDRQWADGRQQFMVRGKHGQYHLPNRAASLIGSAVAVMFGVFWMGMASSMGAPGPFVFFGLIFIGIAVAAGLRGVQKADRYERAEKKYKRQRREILRRLDE